MSYWVHIETDGKPWRDSTQFEPPAPIKAGGNGYPLLCIEFDDLELKFSSIDQLKEFIRVMSQAPLPTTRNLSSRRPGVCGPNSHWLSRLPGKVKSSKVRPKLVRILEGLLKNNLFNSALDTGAARRSA
jgi:hypothetical protein